MRAFSESSELYLSYPELGTEIGTNIQRIFEFAQETRSMLDQKFVDSSSDHFKRFLQVKFGRGFLYRFSDGDINRIQTLINELRQIISKTDNLGKSHKSRLLNRLEKLQSELHKSVSDLDRFWGLLIDASIVLKKVGENAKPIVDRVREIVDIIWRVQIRAEELPSNTPFELPSTTESSEQK